MKEAEKRKKKKAEEMGASRGGKKEERRRERRKECKIKHERLFSNTELLCFVQRPIF
jgi:hypothetical protein